MGWDVETYQPIFCIKNSQKEHEMNTINSLKFAHKSENIFLCGTRDGIIRIFDKRDTKKHCLTFKAHEQKLNSVEFNNNNTCLLTCARDSLIRLWDIRKLIVLLSTYRSRIRRRHWCQR
jgi:WD40 repeat protein